jgi:ATP-dependent RNA helicase HrpA
VFPALEDRGSGIAIVDARSASTAGEMTRRGIARLALLALPQQARHWQQRVTRNHELVLHSRGLELARPLDEAIVQRLFLDCFAPPDAPPPRSRTAFDRRLEEGRQRIGEAGERLLETIGRILGEWRAARGAVAAARHPAAAAAVQDINAQLALLLPPDFIEATPQPWLEHLPRYLRAVVRRLGRLPAEARRDAELASRVRPFVAALRNPGSQGLGATGAELQRLRWMIEEFRVSLFAQDLRTVMRVSEQRLAEQLARVGAEGRG